MKKLFCISTLACLILIICLQLYQILGNDDSRKDENDLHGVMFSQTRKKLYDYYWDNEYEGGSVIFGVSSFDCIIKKYVSGITKHLLAFYFMDPQVNMAQATEYIYLNEDEQKQLLTFVDTCIENSNRKEKINQKIEFKNDVAFFYNIFEGLGMSYTKMQGFEPVWVSLDKMREILMQMPANKDNKEVHKLKYPPVMPEKPKKSCKDYD